MKTFLGFVVKEFRHIFRDRRTLVILFGMPIIQLVLFGFAIRNEVSEVPIVLLDLAHDEATHAITQKLIASPYFDVVGSIPYGAVDDAFRKGRAKAAVVFEPGFERRLLRDGAAVVQVVTDATEPNTANTILAYLRAIVADYQADLPAGVLAAQGLQGATGVRIVSETRMRFNPELRSVVLFVPGLIALILMLVCALMTSITITREKEVGTMEVLLVSPLRPAQIIVGKVMPYLTLSVVNVVTILFLARTVFRVPVRGSVSLLMAECLLFIVCALALGIFISTRTSSQQTAMMISLAGLLLPTVILSGFIFPISSMPAPLQIVSHIVPAKWFLIIIRAIMIKGVGIGVFWKETLVLAAMAAVLLAASVRNFNVRLA